MFEFVSELVQMPAMAAYQSLGRGGKGKNGRSYSRGVKRHSGPRVSLPEPHAETGHLSSGTGLWLCKSWTW